MINIFLLSLLPLAYIDYKKQILPHEYLGVSLAVALCMFYGAEYDFSTYNVIITSILVVILIILPFTGMWGMGDTKLCLILMLVFSTLDFTYILLTANGLAILFNFKNIGTDKLKISFGTYLVIGTFIVHIWNELGLNSILLSL